MSLWEINKVAEKLTIKETPTWNAFLGEFHQRSSLEVWLITQARVWELILALALSRGGDHGEFT